MEDTSVENRPVDARFDLGAIGVAQAGFERNVHPVPAFSVRFSSSLKVAGDW